jgi:glycogen phosphorylase
VSSTRVDATVRSSRKSLDLIRIGFFSRGDTDFFPGLVDGLLWHDPYLLCADFQSYLECQRRVAETYVDTQRWTHMSILNVARSSQFSSDRTIREYCDEIWRVKPVHVRLLSQEDVKVGFMQ